DRWPALAEMRQDDRTTHGIAELRQNVLRIFRLVCSLKKPPRSETAVRVITPASAVKVVAATLDANVDRCAARESLFGVKRVRDDVHFLDRFRRRHVNRVRRQPWIDDAGAVNARVVLQARHAVDVVGDGPLWITCGRVLLATAIADETLASRRAGNQHQDALVVSTHAAK